MILATSFEITSRPLRRQVPDTRRSSDLVLPSWSDDVPQEWTLSATFLDPIAGGGVTFECPIAAEDVSRVWSFREPHDLSRAMVIAADLLTHAIVEKWPGAKVEARAVGDVFAIVVEVP